jgi:hypothetical protein
MDRSGCWPTQIVIWYVTDPERLTASATRAIEEATERDEAVGVLAFALVEMIYAVEKTTNPLTAGDRLTGLTHLQPGEHAGDAGSLVGTRR